MSVVVEAGDGRETPNNWVQVNKEPETPFEQYGMPAAEPELPFDKYGFLITDELPAEKRPARVDERNHGYFEDGLEHSNSAQRVWKKLITGWNGLSADKQEEHIKSGVPSNLRGKVWATVLNITNAQHTAEFEYSEMLELAIEVRDGRVAGFEEEEEHRRQWAAAYGTPAAKTMRKPKEGAEEDDGQYPTAKALKQIDLDLDRTFYDHKNLMEKDGPGQQILRNVLTVYARVNPKVGYCQGMAYIAAVLLMNMPEEQAFWAFYVMMQSQDHFAGFFSENLGRVQHEAAIFEEVVSLHIPELSTHMKNMGIHPLMYVTPWLMCAFTALPLWDGVMAIWDMMMLKGTRTLTRTALAVMTVCKSDLMATTSLGTLLPYLQHLPVTKTSRPTFTKAIWKIRCTTIDTLVAKAEVAIAAAEAQSKKQLEQRRRAYKKRPRTEDRTGVADGGGFSTPAASKRPRPSGAADAAPTPSVFRRFMNSLATPLRTRARMDGAETPAPGRKGSHTAKSALRGRPTPTQATQRSISARTPLLEVNTPTAGSPMLAKAAGIPRLAALGPSSPFASPFGPDSPFNRSGFLSPSFTGRLPTVLSPMVSTVVSAMSPSVFGKESFSSFAQHTPRRTSPASKLGDEAKILEMKTFRTKAAVSTKVTVSSTRRGTPLKVD